MKTISDLDQQLKAVFPGQVVGLSCEQEKSVSRIDFAPGVSEDSQKSIWDFVSKFDWDAQDPDISLFFDGLVKAILAGLLPGDVHSKALMVKDLKSPADQAAALIAFSSDPSYNKEQKMLLDQLIKESGLALPSISGDN